MYISLDRYKQPARGLFGAKEGAPAEKGGAKAPPGLFLVQSGGTAEKGQSEALPGLISVQSRSTAEKGGAKAPPGLISIQSGGHGRKRWSKGTALAFFGAKRGRRPKKGNRSARHSGRS